MEDELKWVVGLIVFVAMIGVVFGVVFPTYNIGSYSDTVACTKNSFCYTKYADVINDTTFSIHNGTLTYTWVEGTNYTANYTLGMFNLSAGTTTDTYTINYSYYPLGYNHGSGGATTRLIAGLLAAAFVLCILVYIFAKVKD